MKYARIVFLQGSEAIEALDILNNEGKKRALMYLQQWDYGELHDIHAYDASGITDIKYIADNYIMSYNISMGYIGLQLIID